MHNALLEHRMKKEIINKWEKSELLNKCTTYKQKKQLCKLLEEGCEYIQLWKSIIKVATEECGTNVIPMAARLYYDYNIKKINFPKLLTLFANLYTPENPTFQSVVQSCGFYSLSLHAEISIECCELYAARYRDE